MSVNTSFFEIAVQKTLKHEGGYVNDPKDPGGETRYGISKRSYPNLDIKNLTVKEAVEIYRQDYWNKQGLEQLEDPVLACKVFDLCVNIGPRNAVKHLQQACVQFGFDLIIDGFLGHQTAEIVNKICHRYSEALLTALKIQAGQYYFSLNKSNYLAGWLRRLDDTEAAGTGTIKQKNEVEGKVNNTQNQTRQKQWYQSKAIWTGIAGLTGAAAAWLTGEMPPAEAVKLGFDAVLGIFLRLGMMQ